MLDPASWLPQAEALRPGERRRTEHDCGEGRTLIIEHTDEALRAYCFRCNDTGYKPHPAPSLEQRLARLQAVRDAESLVSEASALPGPKTPDPRDWPLPARAWLYKAGFSNDRIAELGFYYHAPTERVVLPVFMHGRLVYWQARGFRPDRPKYINPKVDKSKLLGLFGSGDLLVLTEDILSAARIGEIACGAAILGTDFSEAQAVYIAGHAGRVLVWLDPDAAGRKATGRVLRTLAMLGVKASPIESERDPKLYSKKEIATFLST